MGARCPDLLAIDDPIVAIFDRSSAQRCQITASGRLTEQLTPHLFAAGEWWHKALVLLFGRPRHHSGRAHALTNGEDAIWRLILRLFLIEDHLLNRTRPSATVLFRPTETGPTGIVFALLPKFCPPDVIEPCEFCLARNIVLEPGFHFLTKICFLCCIVKIHFAYSPYAACAFSTALINFSCHTASDPMVTANSFERRYGN